MRNSRPIYPNELYHYGIKGMKWGKHKKDSYASAHSDYLRSTAPISNADAIARGRKIASIMSNTPLEDRGVVGKYADPAKIPTSSNYVSMIPTSKPKDYRGSENGRWFRNENRGYVDAARRNEAREDYNKSYVRNHRSDFENAVSDRKAQKLEASLRREKEKF